MSVIWQILNKDRSKLTKDIFKLLDSAGACDWLGLKEAPILLKPNLVVSKPASGGATTHPEIVAAVIEYLKEKGYYRISITEGSWVGDSTVKAYKACGYTALSKHYGVKLIDLQKDDFTEIETQGEKLKICRTVVELRQNGGSLVNLPVLKGHGQTKLTCALKNLKGCIPDSEKRRYHSLGVHMPVALLNTVIKPAFTLVDGLNGDPYWEEGGSPEKRDLLLLGRDSVSIDSYACSLLDIDKTAVKYIAIAESYGVGTSSVSKEDITNPGGRQKQTVVNIGSRNETEASAVKNWINKIVDQRSACSACFGNLAGALRRIKAANPEAVDRFTRGSICIGQDFRGTDLPEGKIGVGICTKGAPVFINGCPPSERAIMDFLNRVHQQ